MNNHQMEQWKKEYEEIPVPESAGFRVRAGIRQAKSERAQRNVFRFMRNTGTAAAAAMVLLTVAVNTSEAAAKTMEGVPVLGGIARIVTFRTYTDQQENAQAQVEIPQIEALTPEEGGSTDAGLKENIQSGNAQIEAYANRFIEEYEAEIQAGNGDAHYALDSRYEVIRDDEQWLSIRINTTVAMASGTQYVKIFNVNRASGSVVPLTDLFEDPQAALSVLSENIREQMRTQMAQDAEKFYFLDSEDPESDFKGLTGSESYYIQDDGSLVIVFNEYEVAPGYMGAVEFAIPGQVTGPLLRKG